MLKNYFNIALRSILKHKGIASINICGMAVGMAASLLILLYVQYELSFDDYHENAGRMYRVTLEQFASDGSSSVQGALLDPPVGPLLVQDYPEIVYTARLTPVGPVLGYEDRMIDSGYCYWADPDLFNIFTIPLLAGNPETALRDPFSLAISLTKARALFGENISPIEATGKSVVVNNKHAFTVTAVFGDLPDNTHLPIDVLGSISTMESWFGRELTFWGSPNYATYVLLAEGASADQLTGKLAGFFERHRGVEAAERNRLHLQPVTDIHLHSNLARELGPISDIRYVYLLITIALFILLIACINYMSLATARSARRAKEVGLRKTAGARRNDLILQFLGESILVAFLSLIAALVLVWFALPFFNAFTGKELGLTTHGTGQMMMIAFTIVFAVGVGAGSYPAFYLSRIRPAAVLKGAHYPDGQRSRLRYILVIAQFSIAIVLLISTFGVNSQLHYVRNQNLGFDYRRILILPTIWDLKEDFSAMHEQLLQHPDVLQVAQSNPVPSGRLSWSTDVTVLHDEQDQLTRSTLLPVFVDENFFPTYGIDFVAGRNFSNQFASDSATGFVLNETAAARLGFSSSEEAINNTMTLGGWKGSVIGVVEDFHFESLHQQIAPMVFYMDPRNYRQVSIRLREGADIGGLIDFLEEKWRQYEPVSSLSYSFLEDRFGATYAAEKRLGHIFSYFAGLALFITCIGLLGIVSYTVEQRKKEIGIRKVLGASTGNVINLLLKEFGVLVGIAFIVSIPSGYLLLRRWMENFAYHTDLSWWIFFLAGFTALGVALVTLSYQTVRAALSNPVKSLQAE